MHSRGPVALSIGTGNRGNHTKISKRSEGACGDHVPFSCTRASHLSHQSNASLADYSVLCQRRLAQSFGSETYVSSAGHLIHEITSHPVPQFHIKLRLGDKPCIVKLPLLSRICQLNLPRTLVTLEKAHRVPTYIKFPQHSRNKFIHLQIAHILANASSRPSTKTK